MTTESNVSKEAAEEIKARTIIIGPDIDDMGLSVPAFRVLAHFTRRADGKGEASPSIASITEVCRITRGTVVAAVRELEARGAIVAVRSPGKLTRYRLTFATRLAEGRA